MENDSAMPQNARKMTKQDTKEMLRFFDSWHEHRDDFSPDADVLNFAFAWASRGAPLPPPQARTLQDQLILHGKQLLEWVPTCSKGSSGFLRQENLRKSIEEIEAINANS